MTFAASLNNIEPSLEHFSTEQILSIEHMLNSKGVLNYKIIPIPGDCSTRNYWRIFANNDTYILMDSNQEPDAFKNFMKIDYFLCKNNLHAPQILAYDLTYHLLLLEDLGNNSFSTLLKLHPQMESNCYKQAIEVLLKLGKLDIDIQLPTMSSETILDGIKVFLEWYAVEHCPANAIKNFSKDLLHLFIKYSKELESLPNSVCLRDYHADNLLWCQDQTVGIIDFQDALIAPIVYDLVSLLEDARRDVSPEVIAEGKKMFFDHYARYSPQLLERGYRIISVARNLRIMGVFMRLMKRDNKPQYVNLLPRMFAYVKNTIAHEDMDELRKLLIIFPDLHIYG